MKRLRYLIVPFSTIAVLAFAAIAAAQSGTPEQTSSEQSTNTANQSNSHELSEPPAVPAQTATPAQTTAPAPNSTITTVDIYAHAFVPEQLNVAPGTTVTFVNNDTEPHTATAVNGLFDTQALESGDSIDIWLGGEGAVTYYCKLHPGMQGSIVVGEAGVVEGTNLPNVPNQPVSVAPQEPSRVAP
jgi:plastocyanin